MTSTEEIKCTVHPLFAVPLVESVAPNADALNAMLRRRFLEMEAEGERHRDSVRRDTLHSVFESNFLLHMRPEPEIKTLCRFMDVSLRQFIAGISGLDARQATQLPMQYHTWFHVTRRGGYQGTHNHPNASWSGIYCVDPGDPPSSPEDRNSGAVRFQDPRAGSNMYRDPTNSGMHIPYQLGSWQLHHEPGRLIIFPSYLLHEIFPYNGERPRIVVAFNAWHRKE